MRSRDAAVESSLNVERAKRRTSTRRNCDRRTTSRAQKKTDRFRISHFTHTTRESACLHHAGERDDARPRCPIANVTLRETRQHFPETIACPVTCVRDPRYAVKLRPVVGPVAVDVSRSSVDTRLASRCTHVRGKRPPGAVFPVPPAPLNATNTQPLCRTRQRQRRARHPCRTRAPRKRETRVGSFTATHRFSRLTSPTRATRLTTDKV